MIKKSLLILFLSISVCTIYSQSIELNVKSLYGIWNNELTEYYYGGAGAELLYEHPLKKGSLRSGLEFRSINWGNQLTLNIGYSLPFVEKPTWSINGIGTTGIGFALLRQHPLFVWSTGYMTEFVWLKKKKINFNIGLGFRYTHNPAYIKYGYINQVFEFPFKVGFKYNFNKKIPK